MSLSFDPQEGLILVPVRLWGPARDTIVHLALDTGATGSLVNWDVAVLLGYDPATVIVDFRKGLVTVERCNF